jgi:threonine-phosphate decarboxylase
MIRGHGGNVHDLARRLGCDPAAICDMSSNVNPLGPMPELMEHLHRRLNDALALPEVDAAAVTEAFARAVGLPPDQVLAGNGSTQIIYLLPRVLAPKRAVVLGPTYADYADACRLAGVEVQLVTADAADGFLPPLGELDARLRSGDMVFICNPNNPTGVLTAAEALATLARAHPACRFVVDESYLPFVGEAASLAGGAPDNVLVLSSLSKVHRIAGLRIGFLAAAPEIVARLADYRPPWSVNAMAQAAVAYIAANPEAVAHFVDRTRRFLDQEKSRLAERLAGLGRLRLFESQTSFVLMQLAPPAAAPGVCAALAEKRILVRDCGNFRGLDQGFIRISLKDAAANARAADCLRQALTAPADS